MRAAPASLTSHKPTQLPRSNTKNVGFTVNPVHENPLPPKNNLLNSFFLYATVAPPVSPHLTPKTMSFDPSSPHAPLDPYLLAAIALTTIGAVVAGIYVSGAGEDFSQWFTEKFLQARAKSEKKVRQHAGGDKAEGVL